MQAVTISVILTLLVISTESVLCKIDCKYRGVVCPDPYTYQFCLNYTDQVLLSGNPTKCPEGTICDDEGFFPCKVGTVPTTTTTPLPTTVPACSGPAKFPTSICNQYLECIQVFFWWQPQTSTCPKGQNFDPSLGDCSENYSCGDNAVTVAPPVVPPQCTGPGNFPGPSPNQYYECVYIWYAFGYQPELKVCVEGEIFDETASLCIEIAPVTDVK